MTSHPESGLVVKWYYPDTIRMPDLTSDRNSISRRRIHAFSANRLCNGIRRRCSCVVGGAVQCRTAEHDPVRDPDEEDGLSIAAIVIIASGIGHCCFRGGGYGCVLVRVQRPESLHARQVDERHHRGRQDARSVCLIRAGGSCLWADGLTCWRRQSGFRMKGRSRHMPRFSGSICKIRIPEL